MMIVVSWLIYCVLIALLLAGVALAWERAARWSGRPARWSWLIVMAGSVTLPFVLRLLPERAWSDAMPAPMQLLSVDALVLSAGQASGWSAQDTALALWAAASGLVLLYVAVVLLELRRAQRRWRAADVDGSPVLVAPSTGPAAVGLRRGAVVVPAWALELDGKLRSLLLKHERAHVDAGDPRLLFAGVVLLAVMPWNPVLWVELLRLRNAIELDCDARVLSGGADPTQYGSLLLEVGRRRSAHAFVMATFAEPRIFLEQRIRRIAHWPAERSRTRAAVFATAALLLLAVALSCDPVRITKVPESVPTGTAVLVADTPTVTPMTQPPELINADEVKAALVEYYPPLLREAGISGRSTVHVYIDKDGTVTRLMLARTSGYPALDEAALGVAGRMRFEPAQYAADVVAVWVEIPIVFTADGSAERVSPPSTARVLREIREPADTPPESRERVPPESRERVPAESRARVTPRAAAPELANRAQVAQLIARNYPPLLRDAGIGGTADVRLHVGTDGTVGAAELAKSSGYPALDEAAVTIGRQLRFTPARRDGQAVPVWIDMPIVFTAK